MRERTWKSVIVSCGIAGILGLGGLNVSAEENAGSDLITVVQEESQVEFDLNQTLQQVQVNLASKIKDKLGLEFSNQLDSEYLKLLQELDTGTLSVGDSDSENIAYSEFAGIYFSRIGSILPENATVDQLSAVNEVKDALLSRTFDSIRTENINLILETEEVAPSRSARAAFNVTNANEYARRWWNRRNMLYPVYDNDCTNFASQIAQAGGKPLRPSPNASGMAWTHTAGVSATSAWINAHSFTNFWTADGVATRHFTSKSEAQSYTRAGDFIAYWKKNTFQITHMAYVSKKSGSTAYITQHTTDRVDTSWNSIDTNAYSSFVIIRM